MADQKFEGGLVEAIRDLAISNSIVEVLQGNSNRMSEQVPLPPGYRIEDTERFDVRPNRFRGAYVTSYIEDFVDYINTRGGADTSRVFLSPEDMKAKAILDMGTRDCPLWGDDTAQLTLKHTPEFDALWKLKGVDLRQRDLIDFLEDWDSCIEIWNSERSVALSLKAAIPVVRAVTVQGLSESTSAKGDFNSSLSSTDKLEVNSKAGSLPKEFMFTCEPFAGLSSKRIWCRLRAIPVGNEVFFRFRVQSQEALLKECVLEFKEALEEQLNVPVHCGSVSYQGKA